MSAARMLSREEEDAKRKLRMAWFGYIGMIFGNFMAILDIQIVASSLREIQAGLSASADELTWVQTSYLIAEVIAIPLSGYLSRMMSTRVYFVTCAIGFTLASLMCGLAWNIESMIFFRVLQGFLGGGMIPTTLGSIYLLFPPEKRTLPTVLVGLAMTTAPALGPTIGGYLTATFSWHWLFFINVVPGVLLSMVVWKNVRFDLPDWSLLRTIDLFGLATMALFLGSLEFVLDEGPRHDWLQDETVRNMAIAMVIGGALFFWRAFTSANPIVQLRTYGNRNFAFGSVVAFVVGVMLYGMVFIVPTFLGGVRDYNSLQIGKVMMVMGVCMFMTAPLVGKLAAKVDLRILLAYGLSMAAAGTWLNAHLTADAGFWQFFWPQVMRGHGFMFCMITMTGLAIGTLKPEEVKNGSGLFNLMRNLGGAIGLALINTNLHDRQWFHYSHLSNSINDARAPVREMLAQGSAYLSPELGAQGSAATLGYMHRLVQQQAAVMSFNDTMLMMSALCAFAVLLLPFADKPPSPTAGAEPSH
ncbi:MAG: DHA2 family efflux MFS transporter permease subunit [Stagnimonas sp.]|nr:DHA2 family efflux MFS transporter permease subunit [Stagnimonas sp.]